MANMANTIRNDRGIALLLVISVTTILIATALEYNRRARFAVISAAAARDRLTLSYMAASGVQAAMALLAKDRAEPIYLVSLSLCKRPDRVKYRLFTGGLGKSRQNK